MLVLLGVALLVCFGFADRLVWVFGCVLGFVFIVFPVAYGVVGCLSAWLRLACCYCVGCLLVVWFGFVDYVVWLFVSLDVFFAFVGGLGLFY